MRKHLFYSTQLFWLEKNIEFMTRLNYNFTIKMTLNEIKNSSKMTSSEKNN